MVDLVEAYAHERGVEEGKNEGFGSY